MIPFFVADRPMSLRIIKGLPLKDYPDAEIGIMAHANTSANFQEALRKYPCENFVYCDAVGGPCEHQTNIEQCPARQHILEHTVKMCDSGIFTKEGATLTYEEMFAAYERMGVKYGIMIDVFQDSQATIESAKKALAAYEPYRDKFKLVAVAHGLTVEEYLECYRELRQMGCEHIAIGGLLKRIGETVRYTQVRDEAFMYQVLDAIRSEFPTDWLFALGSFNPDRIAEFQKRNVWGDYKGWIFQYKKRDKALNPLLTTFANNHLTHYEAETVANLIKDIQNKITRREKNIKKRKTKSTQLNQGKRKLRGSLQTLYEKVAKDAPDLAKRFKKVVTHGLPKPTEENLIDQVLIRLKLRDSEQGQQILDNIQSNRSLRDEISQLEVQLGKTNQSLQRLIESFLGKEIELPSEIQKAAAEIIEIIQSTEQQYRLQQVRQKLTRVILAPLQG